MRLWFCVLSLVHLELINPKHKNQKENKNNAPCFCISFNLKCIKNFFLKSDVNKRFCMVWNNPHVFLVCIKCGVCPRHMVLGSKILQDKTNTFLFRPEIHI